MDLEGLGVACRRGRRVWKCVFPGLSNFRGEEFDFGKKALSGGRDPRFGYEATTLERVSVVMQKVEDFV